MNYCSSLKNIFTQKMKTASDYHATLSALKFLCGEGEDICRLCLAPTTDETTVNIGDSSVIQRPYFEDSPTYVDMFEELGVCIISIVYKILLGNVELVLKERYKILMFLNRILQVSTEDSFPENLCKTCADTVINAYLFKKLCAYSNRKWNEVMDRLASSLNLTESLGPKVKSAYLAISESNNAIYTSRNNGPKHNKTALLKFQNIMKSRKSYAKTKTKKSVKCTECDEKFNSNYQLSKHNVKVHNKTRNSCPQCSKIFTTPAQLECHAERVHYPKKIQCPKCDKMFSTHRMLKYHDKSQHIAAICKLCCVQFPSKLLLRAHLDKHDVNNCPKCGKGFINIHTFKAHLKFCGNSEERRPKFFCDICNKGYVHKNGIRSHLKTDHGFGNVLTCKWCNKKFDAVSKLRNHMVKHTRERNFHCEHCGNLFVTQAALVYHVRLHTGERPFPCDLCNESFLSASRRMEHKRRKHIGPTIQCPLCPMKFVKISQLRKHTQRHSNPHSKLYCPGGDELQPVIEQYIPPLNYVSVP